MIYKILIMLSFLSFPISCFAQVKIEMKTGETYTGFIISENDSLIKIKSTDDMVWDIPADQIKIKRPIVYNFKTIKGEKYTGTIIKPPDSNYTISQSDGKTVIIPRKELLYLSNNNYISLGITLGSPGGINLFFGYNIGDFSIRSEIGTDSYSRFGLQANISYNISYSKTFESNISIGAGYTDIPYNSDFFFKRQNSKYTYIGIFCNLIANWLFMECGLGYVTSGYYSYDWDPLFFKVGYVYRFND